MGTNGNPPTKNLKATPIPVVPRTMKIVNPDGTPTRSGLLLLEQLQSVVTQAGGGGGGGQEGDATGPVTGFTSASEVGVRYTDPLTRLVHMTVGFVPIVPTPQPVTYLISSDNGATWVWIGSQRMQNPGQVLKVDRLAPGQNSTWKVACVAGNLGGDPNPLADANLNTLYPGVVRSNGFLVAGLQTPAASTGIQATIGTCTDAIRADGSHYGVIPGVVYTDPIGTNAFFVRITVTNLDASKNVIVAEQPHGGTQITGGTHTEADLWVTYIPALAFIRYRFYVANRNSQGGGDFTNPATNTLQNVFFNGSSTAAQYYDVPITIPPDPGGGGEPPFNVLSVTASEVGPKYQDVQAGLHTTIGVIPVIDVDYTSPRTVTIWFDFGNGEIVWQGWYSLTAAGQVVRIGDSTLGTDGVRKSGDIWVPANTAQGNWIVYCAPGKIDKGIDATSYHSFHFVVVPVTACLPNGTTNAQFINDPSTGDPISYSLWDPGIWYWQYYELTWTPPNIATDPNFWFTMITIQKGGIIGGVWTPAPDSEGINESPTLSFLGRVHDEVMQLPGLANDQVSVLRKFGSKPATWVIPVAQNPDMTPNPYRTFRFWLYSVSRLGTDTSGSGGAGTYTLQTSCWPGGADHFDLSPVPKNGTLDIRAANPATIALPLTGGNGLPLTVGPGEISNSYLGNQSVQANNMAAGAITVANDALAAEVVIDPKIKTVGINKVTYGTSVFAGDVVLTRGIGQPVIYLKAATSGPDPAQNPTGIYLFGQGDATSGVTGLTSKPYAVFQSTGLSFFSGGTGPQILLSATGLTIWTVQGDVTHPYYSVTATALTFVNGPNSVTINSNALAFVDGSNNNRLDMNSGGLSISNSTNKLVITAGILQLQMGGSARITLDSNPTNGITISNGGSASVQITASTVTIINGAFSLVSGTITINIDATNLIKAHNSSSSVTCTMTGDHFIAQRATSPNATTGQLEPGILYLFGSDLSEVQLTPGGLSFSIAGGALQTVIDSNLIWRHGVQCTDHVIGNDFGIATVSLGWPQTAASGSPVPPGGYGPGLAQGQVRTFTTGDGRTAYVCGGLIVNVV
jgi:hypothetical protein